jgi:hypothetical protein
MIRQTRGKWGFSWTIGKAAIVVSENSRGGDCAEDNLRIAIRRRKAPALRGGLGYRVRRKRRLRAAKLIP